MTERPLPHDSDQPDVQNIGDTELTWEEMRPWIEFSCWSALVMCPILFWLNGPAVSDDQYVVRNGMVILAACGAIGLRLLAYVRKPRS